LPLRSIFPEKKKTTSPKQVPCVVAFKKHLPQGKEDYKSQTSSLCSKKSSLGKKTMSQGNNEFSHIRAQVPSGEMHFLYLGKSPNSLIEKTSLKSNEFSLGKG